MLTYSNAVLIGIAAYVFADVLTNSGEIFARYGDWLYRNHGKWWAKPLGYCGKCLAGQLALWIYLFSPDYDGLLHTIQQGCVRGIWSNLISPGYNGPVEHAAFICVAIYTYILARKWAT